MGILSRVALSVILLAALPVSISSAQESPIKITDAKTWRSALRAWILAYSSFPDLPHSPAKKGEAAPPPPSGRVIVSFVLDRQGRLMASGVTESSGRPELDRAALTNLKRAEPFPKPPANIPGQTFRLTIPIHFDGGPQKPAR